MLKQSGHIFCIPSFLKKTNLGPKIDKMTYTRDIIVVALSFGKKTIPDLPCKDWWTLAFIVGNAFHYARGGHSWLGSTNGTRLDRARLIVPAKKKKKMEKIRENLTCHKGRHSTALTDLTFHFCLTAASKIWLFSNFFLRLVTFHVVLATYLVYSKSCQTLIHVCRRRYLCI